LQYLEMIWLHQHSCNSKFSTFLSFC